MEDVTRLDIKRDERACVYTVLTGGYEVLNEQPVAGRSDLPFICFTDDPTLTSPTWQIRVVKPLFPADPVRSQRAIKLLPHKFLPDFDASLYIDNSVLLKVKPEEILQRYLASSPFALFWHSDRPTLTEEFHAVAHAGYDDVRRVAEQFAHYSATFPELLDNRPFWAAILLRRHADPLVRHTMEIWRDHVLRYSRRDQLSFNIACAITQMSPNTIIEDCRDSWMHSWPHVVDRKRVLAYGGGEAWMQPFEQYLPASQVGGVRDGMSAALSAMEAEIAALKASKSWRVTAPMRSAATAARRAAASIRSLPARRRAPPRRVRGAETLAPPEEAAQFAREGYVGPRQLLTAEQCRLILDHYRHGGIRANPQWPKDLADRDPLFYDLANRPAIVATVERLLGHRAVVWGASVIEREPGQVHRIHTDIESAAPEGGHVSVWIGLEGTSRDSALQLISRSHTLGTPVQKEFFDRKQDRAKTADATVLEWARSKNPDAKLVQPSMADGDALFFDGRLWHGSRNTGSDKRTALLLQYAKAGTKVAIQEVGASDWPFRMSGETARCLPVDGSSAPGNASNPHNGRPLASVLDAGDRFVPVAEGFKPYHLLRGATPNVSDMESHVSVLSPGHSPHPPHHHVEEELLIVLDGEAELIIPDTADPAGARVERLTAGGIAYYPAYQYHTIRNVSSRPVTYLMYKWRAAPKETSGQLGTTILHTNQVQMPDRPMAVSGLMESPTGYLSKLHAHLTTMKPGAGYDDHVDDHDVAIIVFDGTVDTLGKRIGPMGTAFSPAGEPHGLRNSGDVDARYLVFEFHA
ncbi:cupin domain-containing protein [Mesorhizobium sp. ZMM04-5]|uniref:Cupin domain-containing protein n=1 Tax=Mesorhizobium marinum TaxID=3228790 RepID=A0ABV3QUU7_9HYPH